MTTWRDGRRALRIAFFAGLVLRLIILMQTGGLGTEIADEQHYRRLAQNLVDRHEFSAIPGEPTSIRPPLYPALVAAVWTVAGRDNLQAVRVLQILLALVTTVLVYQLGRRLFNPAVGRWAAAVFWLYPNLIFFDFLILTETLFTLWLVLFALLLVMLVQTPRAATAVACGVALGLSALTRSVLWPLPLLLCPLLVVLVRGPWRLRLAVPVLLFAGFVATITPWAIRNTRLQGVTTIVDTMGGINLRMGNYEYTPEDRIWDAVSVKGDKNWVAALSEEPWTHTPTEGEKDKWAQRKAIEYMRAHPGTTLRRGLIKFADFWGLEREFIAGIRAGFFHPPAWFAAIATAAVVVSFPILALAGAAGLWLAPPRDWRSHLLVLLPLAVITGIHTLVFGHSRYHLPLIPTFSVYACALCLTWRERRPTWNRLQLAGAIITVVLLAAIWLRQIVIVDADRIRALFE